MEIISNMQPLNALILILAILGGIFLLFKVAGRLLKTVGIIILIALVWFFWQGGTVEELKGKGVKTLFPNVTASGLKNKYCQAGEEEKTKCICLASPIYDDLSSRFTPAQLAEIDLDRNRIYEEIRLSMKNQKREINNCLIKNKGAKGVEKFMDLVKEIDKIEIRRKEE